MSLKQKTLQGLSWSFIDNFAIQIISFAVGIVLARLIDPAEFGILGLITIFMALSTTFVDSGFASALVRKNDCTDVDYSTVFFYNLSVGTFLYSVLFFTAPLIASFFDEPRLTAIVRVSGLGLIIGSIGTIQGVLLVKKIDFKLKAKISAASSIIAGAIAIFLAYKGYGVWSLVWRTILGSFFGALFIWFASNWRPMWTFSVKSFKELFGFGSKLLLSSLINTAVSYIYYPIIGKFFSPTILGFYTRAENFSNLFTSTLTKNIQRVSYPVLATIQDDPEQLKSAYRKMINSTMIITFSLMMGLAAVAKPLIIVLIGEKWLPCVPYLQLMCFSGMLYPLQAMNLNAINVKGRSDLFLKLEIVKTSLIIPLIFVGIYLGIEALLIGGIILSVISFFLNSHYSGELINYSTKEQLKDLLPLLLVAGCASLAAWGISFFNLNNWVTLILQLVTGFVLTIVIYDRLKHPDYLEIKQIVLNALKKIIPAKNVN